MKRSLPAGVLAGFLIAFSAVPWPQPWWAFFGVGALYLALLPDGDQVLAPGKAMLVGLVAGTVANLCALYWMPEVFITFASFPTWLAWLLSFGLYLWQAAPFALACLATAILARLGTRPLYALPLAITVAFTAVQTLFPWRLATTAVPFLPFVQVAELGSQSLIDLLVALVGCGLADAARLRLRAPGTGAYRLPAKLAAAALVLPTLYGLVRIPMVEARRAEGALVRVGVVQPNVSIHEKHDQDRAPELLARLQGMTRAAERAGAMLTVWPETAYPYPFPRGIRSDRGGSLRVRTEGIERPVVFGAVTESGECSRYNSVLAMDAEGRVRSIADKRRLLPFTEVIPLWHNMPWLRARFRCPGFRRGPAASVLHLDEARIGVLNCYEDILPVQAFHVARLDPDFLLNVTNDAWFGDTHEPYLHHQAARLRTIETRRDLVRVVNTGVSGHVSATGRDLFRTDTFEPVVFVADVRVMHGRTPWLFLGDWVTALCALLLAWPIVRFLRARAARLRAWLARRRKKSSPA